MRTGHGDGPARGRVWGAALALAAAAGACSSGRESAGPPVYAFHPAADALLRVGAARGLALAAATAMSTSAVATPTFAGEPR